MLEHTGVATYGWCDRCKDRVGRRHYRELVDGFSCRDCDRKYGMARGVGIVEARLVSILPPPTDKPPRKKRRKKAKPYKGLRENRTKPALESKLEDDERLLVDALSKIECGYHWHAAVAESLGWSTNKIRSVSRRLFKKGYKLRPNQEDSLLKIIQQNPWSSAAELAPLCGLKISWLSVLLKRLVDKEQIVTIRCKSKVGNSYFYRYGERTETMNLLFYGLQVNSESEVICAIAYSQKFRGWGIFTKEFPAQAIANISRDLPVVDVGSIPDFQKWINAHPSSVCLSDSSVSGVTFHANYVMSDLILKATGERYSIKDVLPLNITDDRAAKSTWNKRNYHAVLESCFCLTNQARDLHAIAQSGQLRLPNEEKIAINLDF